MKFLVAGLGSIGQRHVRNLRALLGDQVDILAYRVRGLPRTITDAMAIEEGQAVEERYHLQSFDRLDRALAERPDAVLVCNPTSLHLTTALAAVRAGCHVLIEKPLADSLAGVEALVSLAGSRGVVAAVGYQMRFHPALVRLRELLCSGTIGQVEGVRAEFGEFLPSAHPYEDYRQSYAARAELGGGVILCYIHEFDYLCWLFGMPRQVVTIGGRSGVLEVDVEDHATTRMTCCVGGRPVVIEVHQDFLQQPGTRTCDVIGNAGTIHVDFNAPLLVVADAAGHIIERRTFDGFTRNQMYRDAIAHFLSAVGGADAPLVTAREGAISLRVALAARESLASARAIELS
jgi:predicted dehydrogenase